MYLITLPLQLLSTGAFLEQGSTALTAISAVHAGFVAATFWALLGNAIVSTQVVEDGTMSSLVPFDFGILAFLAATIYIALDVGFSFTSVFGPSNPPDALGSIPLFVLTSIWPGAATILYFGIMAYVVLGLLNEVRPMWYYVLAAVLFVLSQLDYFLLSKVICKAAATGAVSKVDGSFIATILETAAVGVLYLAWRSITEGASHMPQPVSRSVLHVLHATSRPFPLATPLCGAARLSCLMSRPPTSPCFCVSRRSSSLCWLPFRLIVAFLRCSP
ncbi:hypothetical protein K466DRAFT_557746 [Polyporus arcularius HHB13444]|uniref:Uncharacterized protein n=1 Tax=Polyporus arcularius HHB13444 TaxID=1314778 RepID=A0A5C3NXU3_9APHY|nr:hypothetical protein K466DRAFT_557746 [Polyporus arcularius HHB13444]